MAQGSASAAPGTSLSFNPGNLAALYQQRQHAQLADEFLRVLEHFRTTLYTSLAADAQYAVNAFCKHFLYLFTQPDFHVDRGRGLRFIALNHVIANLVALSAFRTTDAWLAVLLGQQQNFLKLLALYNPRCTTRIPRKALFDTDVNAASIWYFSFYQNYKTVLAEDNALAHMREHMAFIDSRLDVSVGLAHEAYFSATYIDADNDHPLKHHINRTLQTWKVCRTPIDNRPNPRKIAVLTSMWFRRQSVYRCMHGFLSRLARDFELTLFHLGADNPAIDGGLFEGGVKRFQVGPGTPDLSIFTPNDYALAFYPDIGMSVESVVLANVRLAPVQVCGYGHPVSTYGSLIDYWLGGREVESIEHAASNYSERLVLIPGAGVAPLRPDYRRKGATPAPEPVIIGCPWYAQKTNAHLLALAARIIERAARPVRFRVFPGGATVANGLIPFRRALVERLGADHVTVYQNLDYDAYMHAMEGCHFCIDSWPFGGYATVTDALWLRKPVVSIEGRKFFNRAGAHLLRAVGLEELVVDSSDAYVDTIVDLVDRPSRLQALQQHVENIDLEQVLFSEEHADAFNRAIHHLLDNHQRLAAQGDRSPILID